MRNIAVIGNSHAAALHVAWTDMKKAGAELGVTFFLIGGGQFFSLTMREGKHFGLHGAATRNDELRERMLLRNGTLSIDVSKFDHILLVGHNFRENDLLGLLDGTDIDGIRETGADQLVSSNALEAFLEATVSENLPKKYWRNRRDTRVWVVQKPRPSEGRLSERQEFSRLEDDNTGIRPLLGLYNRKIRAALEAEGMLLIDQPAETIADGGLTRSEFARGSIRLQGKPHHDHDHAHMNADYGALQWQEILSVLEREL